MVPSIIGLLNTGRGRVVEERNIVRDRKGWLSGNLIHVFWRCWDRFPSVFFSVPPEKLLPNTDYIKTFSFQILSYRQRRVDLDNGNNRETNRTGIQDRNGPFSSAVICTI